MPGLVLKQIYKLEDLKMCQSNDFSLSTNFANDTNKALIFQQYVHYEAILYARQAVSLPLDFCQTYAIKELSCPETGL